MDSVVCSFSDNDNVVVNEVIEGEGVYTASSTAAATSATSNTSRNVASSKPARVAPVASAAAPASKAAAEGGQQVVVKSGDTASKIAARRTAKRVKVSGHKQRRFVAKCRQRYDGT